MTTELAPPLTMGGLELVLEDTLVEYITEWTKNDYFKVKRNLIDPSYSDAPASEVDMGPAIVHAGMLPKNEVGQVLVDDLPTYPAVLVHITHGIDKTPEGCVYTNIIAGVWDNNSDFQGYRDAVILIRKIVRNIWYWDTLGNSFQKGDMTEGTPWRVYNTNESTWPFFFAEATIPWRLRTPYMRAERDDLDFQTNPEIQTGYPASTYPTTITTT